MFYQPAIVFLSKFQICSLDSKEKSLCLKLTEQDWQDQKIAEKLKKFLQEHNLKNASLLLADDLCYSICLKYPENVILSQDYIKKELTKIIPEEVAELAWDFEVKNFSQDKKVVQLMVVSSKQLASLATLFKQDDSLFQGIYSYSYALANFFEKNVKPLLLITTVESNIFATIIFKGCVVYSRKINKENFSQDINVLLEADQLIDLLPIEEIVVSSDLVLPKLEQINKKIKVAGQKVDITRSSIFEKKIKQDDEKELGFEVSELAQFFSKHSQPLETKQNENQDLGKQKINHSEPANSASPEQFNEQLKKTAILTVLLIIVVVMSVLAYKKIQPSKIEEKQTEETSLPLNTSPEAIKEVIEESSEAKFNPILFSIKVLNGSGKTGEAGKVKEMLVQAGFDSIQVGNADKSSYKETIIKTSNQALFDKLKEILETRYTISSSSASVATESSSSAEIIIGQELIE